MANFVTLQAIPNTRQQRANTFVAETGTRSSLAKETLLCAKAFHFLAVLQAFSASLAASVLSSPSAAPSAKRSYCTKNKSFKHKSCWVLLSSQMFVSIQLSLKESISDIYSPVVERLSRLPGVLFCGFYVFHAEIPRGICPFLPEVILAISPLHDCGFINVFPRCVSGWFQMRQRHFRDLF